MKKNNHLLPPRMIYYVIFLWFVTAPFMGVWAQTNSITIKGAVHSTTGEELIGVNVSEKGTTSGTITDIDGNYSLTVSDNKATLIFSYIGFITQEVAIDGRSTINVELEEDTQSLDEVVVVGYGTMKKSDLTGAVGRISMEEKSVLPNVNLAQALSGASAGVNIQQTGLVGKDPKLSIRGKTSLSAKEDPLIVLDGIIYNGSLSDINTNDVEQIDILKDASAAAVYGSRSANGVILITTKKGKAGKAKVSVNMYYGTQRMTNNPMRVMNADEYAVRLTDYYYQQGLYKWYKDNKPTSAVGKPVRPDITNRKVVSESLRTQEERDVYLSEVPGIDWVDQVLRDNPIIQSYDVNYAGRSERVNYYVSASYSGEEGILKNDQFNRYTLNTKVDGKLTDWLTLGVNINYSYRDYSGMEANLSHARYASPLAKADLSSPDKYQPYLTGEVYMEHPLARTKADNKEVYNNLFLVTSARIDVPFIEGLSYDFNYSNTYFNRTSNTFYPNTIHDGAKNKGKAEKYPEEKRSWIFNNIVTYIKDFGDHRINTTLLYSREKYAGGSYLLTAEGFDNPVLGYNNMALATKLTTTRPSAWEEMGVSYMARLNYQYKNRYMVTGTVRRDGFSGFSPKKRFVTLPAVSLGWVASEEPFMQSMEWLYLKMRLSYGQNGNQGVGRYSSFSQMHNTNYVYGSTSAIAVYPHQDKMGNPSLAWETTSSYNVGLDFGLWNQRISGSVDVYVANTSDVLVKRKLPWSTGYEQQWANLGGIQNKGIDLELNTVNIESKDFSWNTGFIFTLNRDKITKLYGDNNDRDIGNQWFVGEPIKSIYDYKMSGGIWTEEEFFSGKTHTGWYPGQYKYDDLNGDGKIDPENDRTIVGYETPNFSFSISNTFKYKNWSLFFLLNSIQGGNGYYMFNNYEIVNVSQRSDDIYRVNQSAVRQYWTPDNGVNNATGIYNSPAVHSRILESRSFVRLQDVSLTYNCSPKVLKALGGLDYLQLYLSGKNLYTWTKWSGWDPEIMRSNNLNGYKELPNARNLIMGVKISF